MKIGIVIGLGTLASLIAGTLIVNDFQAVIDVLHLADPTGFWGIYLHLGGLLANLAVVFVTVCAIVQPSPSPSNFRLWTAVAVFIPPLLEAVAALPCFLRSRPGALCGVGVVLIAYGTIPLVLAAAILFIALSHSKTVMFASLALAAAFFGSAAIGKAHLTPSDASQCLKLAEVTRVATCVNVFATRTGDENLCRSIKFRSTRFSCLRDVAIKKAQPQLCEEIRDNSPIEPYESPAVFFRDGCFLNMAYALHDRSQCAKVEDSQLRANCERGVLSLAKR